jgi:hypothetical protein
MASFAEYMGTCGRRARNFGERLASDIPPALFARKANVGGTVVDANHPAFVYGHLSLYPVRMLGFLNLPADAAQAPAEWEKLFNPGCPCQDDPEGRIYPAKETLVTTFLRTYDAVLDALPRVKDEAFAAPTPEERYRAFLPTVGSAVLSMLNNHPSLHFGQLSTWRRCMGLGAVAM